jgi:cation:H+ antiporter
MLFIYFLLFALGLFFLIKGADLLVDGASAIAKRLKVSDLVIGLTIVAFGTSMPELIVSLFSAISGNTDIAIGNIIGSNIANIFLILGVSAIIYPISVKHGTVWREIPFSLLAAVMLGILANDAFFNNAASSGLERIDGLVLIGFFTVFLFYTFGVAKNNRNDAKDSAESFVGGLSKSRSITYILSGLALLTVGGKLGVDNAVKIALELGLSQAFIGLTIVAIGTSLPELATSAIAAFKKKTDIAIGNVVGSNIFNVFWVLGLSAFITPLPFNTKLNTDTLMVILASLMLFIAMFIGKKNHLQKTDGIIYVLLYAAYLFYLVIRG